MGYRKEIYDKAFEIVCQRRRQAEEKALINKEAFYSICARAEQIERELSSTAIKAAKYVLGGENIRSALTSLKEKSLSLQKERTGLLLKNGFTADFLEIKYTCKRCKDTGYINGKICSCFFSLVKQEAFKELNASSPLELSTFSDFSLNYYDGREERNMMRRIFDYCKEYATSFNLSSESIIMFGGSGLGKTHLSLAIANEVINRGFGVVYGTIQSFARKFENERFKDLDSSTFSTLLDCDLLILDDLGTEIPSAYITASIYEIIDTRLMKNIPTIISTNLSTPELQKKYSERLISRIFGNFRLFKFLGNDIRLKKLNK